MKTRFVSHSPTDVQNAQSYNVNGRIKNMTTNNNSKKCLIDLEEKKNGKKKKKTKNKNEKKNPNTLLHIDP
jgi:hypothetical protein